MVIGIVPVHRQKWELADELNALPQGIAHTGILGSLIVGCQGENTLRHGVQHILRGSFHDDIPREISGQCPAVADDLFELLFLPLIR